jgi:UDPglucose 6-dehydrogenase
VEKSTVPAGSADRLSAMLSGSRPGIRFEVVSNPEFLREGSAVQDILNPNRILVGSDSHEALATMRELYAPLIQAGVRWIETDVRTAELAKHACNAFLALKVSFANALARLAEAAGADVTVAVDVMGADPRIGRAHLSAGLGYGGFCLPNDLQAFNWFAASLGYEFPLLREVSRINADAIDAVFDKVRDGVSNLDGKRVAVLGLSFKPGTDDVRFSPALALARRLLRAGARVVGYDPHAGGNAKSELPELEVSGDPYSALDQAHCAVLATDWPEIADLDLDRVHDVMSLPVVIDGRNVFEPEVMRAKGFIYLSTGRRPVGS